MFPFFQEILLNIGVLNRIKVSDFVAAVPREDYDKVCKLVDQKNTENERLSKFIDENQLEIFKLKEIVDDQRDSQQSSIQERLQQDEELTSEIDALQKGVYNLKHKIHFKH